MEKNPCYLTVKQILHDNDVLLEQTSLYKHYKNFSAKTLADLYHIEGSVLENFSYDSIFLPWIHHRPVTAYNDCAFMKPTSDDLIKNQIEKLRELIASFKAHGYSPEKFPDRKLGHVTGYQLQQKMTKKYYIVSGNHRVATMFGICPDHEILMLNERVSFMKPRDLEQNGTILQGEFPTIFTDNDVSTWPSVSSGFIDEHTALQIFDRYITA